MQPPTAAVTTGHNSWKRGGGGGRPYERTSSSSRLPGTSDAGEDAPLVRIGCVTSLLERPKCGLLCRSPSPPRSGLGINTHDKNCMLILADVYWVAIIQLSVLGGCACLPTRNRGQPTEITKNAVEEENK
ncbi:uncharacterized protein LOC124693022 [Lolium rigidum]|uniref:uncharacterized protein LOC124693022 n=1 Tax=Lolium rigidum TaxID=89674 RepID=UPI001F5D8C0A|nr:uncharacterized protein LOC124693022 [Lolium rigidum]